jgi:hypothetical protein
MIHFPNGITGFYHTEKNQPSKVDGKQFKHLSLLLG